MKKNRKNIDLSEDAIKTLTIMAIKSPLKNFKTFVENHLEKLAAKNKIKNQQYK